MSSHLYRHRLTMLAVSVLLCTAIFLAQPSPASAQTPAIQFTATVPPAPAQMQIYRLAATRPPIEFLNEKLSVAKLPALKLERDTYVVRGATGESDQDKVRVFVDQGSGDAHLVPNLAELVRLAAPREPLSVERLQAVARTSLTDERFIPRDVTEVRIAEGITVMGGATTRASVGAAPKRTEPRVVMTIVPAFRYAAGFRVYGRGSHAAVSLANDGATVGALRRWRTASLGERIETRINPEQVRAEIERQLAPQVKPKGSRAIVDKIEVAYYDGNADYMQPVYYFEATVEPADKRISDIKAAGYIPIGKELEPIPDLAAAPSGERPGVTKPAAARKAQGAMNTAGTPGDITLGEFANQDWPTSGAYLDMANNFYSGLVSGSQPVSRTLWWTAYVWQVVGPQSKDWMNAVNVAYTEPHGDWLINSTLSNCCQIWNVANIGMGGNPGYGAAAGGVLATWVVMSCEMIPSAYDRQNEIGGTGNPYVAFEAWFQVFQGLHNVIGFRTIMFYPDDALNYGFGWDAARGGDVNAAWFDEVAAVDGNDGTYASQHLIGNPTVHYDRASTMIDARDLGQSIFSVGAQSASSTLWNFWMAN